MGAEPGTRGGTRPKTQAFGSRVGVGVVPVPVAKGELSCGQDRELLFLTRAYKHRWVQPLNISFIRGQLTSFGAKAGITPCHRAGCTRSGILGVISGPVTLVAAAWAVFLQHRADNEAVACCEMTKPDVSCLCTAPGLFLSPPWRASPLGMRCSHCPAGHLSCTHCGGSGGCGGSLFTGQDALGGAVEMQQYFFGASLFCCCSHRC